MKNEKVTIYFRGGMGAYCKVEAKAFEIEVGPYAQYGQAVTCRFIPKGARNVRGFVQTYAPSLVIVKGWGHFEPESMMAPAEPGNVEGVTIQRGRHSVCSPKWDENFGAAIAGSSALVVHDFRGHNAMALFIGPAEPTPAERYAAERAAEPPHFFVPETGRCFCGDSH